MCNSREVILLNDIGRICRGAKVSMATCTAVVVKNSKEDLEISLQGPFDSVHKIEVSNVIAVDPFNELELGDYVDFRLSQLIGVAICSLD